MSAARQIVLAFAAGVTIAASLLVSPLASQTAPTDPILKAMHDELERSRTLSMPGLEKPYFIRYAIEDGDSFAVSATLGGVVTRRRDHFRMPDIQVRVGDYQFDNTNYYYGGFGFGMRSGMGRLPLEDDYNVIRRYLWLSTDSSYKSAVEALARKRAALRNLTLSDQLNDFAHAQPLQYVGPVRKLQIDEDAWTNRVRALSALFDNYPGVKNSSVELELGQGVYYLVTSEGTVVRTAEGVSSLRARLLAQAPDGMTVRDAVSYHSLDPARLALEAEMRRGLQAAAENVTALTKAPRGEDYNGPVLFEGVAGAQVMAEVLGRNLILGRRPVTDPGRGGNFIASELEGRQGARILPEWMNVVDDPSQTEWRGRPLLGSYEVDREGVRARPLRLVEKGVLKTFLLTRQPVRGYEGSNGRARMPGSFGTQAAGFSNLFISASETVPLGELKKQMLAMLQSRGKTYGIVVRKMDFPSSASYEEVRQLLTSQSGGSRPVSLPLLAYKVYSDGREELVRGLRFRGFNARSLKDIVAAGDDSTAFEYLENTAPFALIGAGNYVSETCVVAPSLLIDDLELHPVQEELPKLPIVPPPDRVR